MFLITMIRAIFILYFIILSSLANGQSDTLIANEYFKKADSLSNAAHFDSSIFYYEKASIIYEKVAQMHLGIAFWAKYVKCYRQMGWNYMLKAQYFQAIEYLEKGLAAGLDRLGSENIVVADCYNVFGVIYENKGEYDKAMEYYKRSLNIKLTKLGINHPHVAITYNNIGIAYDLKGDYDRAMEYYRKALNIKLKTLKKDDPSVAKSYHNMGIVYYEAGDYYTALDYYNRSLNIFVKTMGKEHPYTASSYNWMGLVFIEIGEDIKAMEYYKRALYIYLKTLGKDHPGVAHCHNNIGNVYFKNDDYDKAIEYHQQALRIRIKTLGKDHPDVAMSYINMGHIYVYKGENNKAPLDKRNLTGQAIEYYTKSLNISLKAFGSYHPDVGECYNAFGYLYRKTAESFYPTISGKTGDFAVSQYRKALEYYQKAIPSLVKNFKGNSIYINPVLKKVFIPGKAPKMEGVQSMPVLLNTLEGKAEAFEKKWLASL